MKKQVWLWLLLSCCVSMSQAETATRREILVREINGKKVVGSLEDCAGKSSDIERQKNNQETEEVLWGLCQSFDGTSENYEQVEGGYVSKTDCNGIDQITFKKKNKEIGFLKTCGQNKIKFLFLEYQNKKYVLTRDVDDVVLGGLSSVPYKDLSGELTLWVRQKRLIKIYHDDHFELERTLNVNRLLEVTIQDKNKDKKVFEIRSDFYVPRYYDRVY
jgi:hypothetical protein